MSYLHRIKERMGKIGPRRTHGLFESAQPSSFSSMLTDSFSVGDKSRDNGDYISNSNSVYACITGRSTLLKSLPLKLFRFESGSRMSLKQRRFRAKQLHQKFASQWNMALGMSTPEQGDIFQRIIDDHKRQISVVGLEEVTEGEMIGLLTGVNPFWTFQRLVELTEMGLGLWGKAFWILDSGEDSVFPREIWAVPGDRMVPIPSETDYIAGYAYTPQGATKPIEFSAEEVIWFNYSDPRNLYGSLPPLDPSRIYADYERDSMKANQNLHRQGFQMGGVISPGDDKTVWQPNDAAKIEEKISRRFKGVDKAHRWAVFRQKVNMDEFGISPKDAEFLGGLNWSLEAICRAYKWPIDLVGGQRTYENYQAAMRAAWTQAVIPEATFIASEIIEQLLPRFPGEVDFVWFDSSQVPELQEAETEKWARAREQIEVGALTINDWRRLQGQEPYPWGDVWWAPANRLPAEMLANPTPEQAEARKLINELLEIGDELYKRRDRAIRHEYNETYKGTNSSVSRS